MNISHVLTQYGTDTQYTHTDCAAVLSFRSRPPLACFGSDLADSDSHGTHSASLAALTPRGSIADTVRECENASSDLTDNSSTQQLSAYVHMRTCCLQLSDNIQYAPLTLGSCNTSSYAQSLPHQPPELHGSLHPISCQAPDPVCL